MSKFTFLVSLTIASTAGLQLAAFAQPQLSPQQQQQIRNLNLPPSTLNQPFNSILNTPSENRFPQPLEPLNEPILEWKTDAEASKCTTSGGYKGHWISYKRDGKEIVECFNQEEHLKLIFQNAK